MAQYEIKKCDITIECGATFTMHFVVRDNNNSLVDLTGSTVEAQLREYAEANDYFEFTATHNGSGGRVTLTMPFEDTAAIPYTSGVYDVYITDQNNDREKYLVGDVDIVPAVTKPVAGEIIYLLSFASEDDFPSYGMVRRLYFSHASNHIYRWNGTDYVDIVTDGEAATVEVGDVETLPAGSDATVENVGSLLNAVFNFGIPEGNGIASIEKTGTDVLTDTYTVTFTDPNVEAFDFDVTNGKGIVSIAEVVSGLTHTFTVTYNDGDTFTYTLTDGNGIVSVEKTGATDNVDHYRITFDDGTYFDYDVTNVDTSEFYDKDEIDTLLADKADVGDSYTKDEEDALLADKADSADLGDLASKDTVDWDSDIDNIPSTFPPEAHNHDDRYYTETETDALLSAKADSSDVYTKTAVDTALALKANSADVYTKTATDALLLDKAPVILNSASGSIASFSDGSASPVTALSVGIEPVQAGAGDPSPENVRPITGWTSATVTRTGKNVCPLSPRATISHTVYQNGYYYTEWENATAGQSILLWGNWGITNAISLGLKAGYYTYSFTAESIDGGKIGSVPMRVSVHGTEAYVSWDNGTSRYINEDDKFFALIYLPSAGSYKFRIGLQLELGSSATSYEPYQGQTVTIDLDGTRYGGSLNVLTGEMTVTHGYILLDGTTETWRKVSGGKGVYCNAIASVVKKPSSSQTADITSNILKKINTTPVWLATQIGIAIGTTGDIGVSLYADGTDTTVAEMQTLLIGTPMQLVYELATPLTVQLSPSTMQTLLRQNHLWSDTGDTEVTYRADTKLFVQGQIAETLDSVKKAKQIITDVTTEMVAPRNLAEGDYVIVGDDLLKTTATVASGSALTIGINCVKTTVAEALIALATASE